MSNETKRIVFDGIDSISVQTSTEDMRPLEAGEVRVAPWYLGICGSDLHVLAGGHPFAQPPTVPGHEVCAEVTEIADGVGGVEVGDHVVIDPIMACGHCRACLSGRPNLCEPPMVAGFRAPGFGRTSHVVPARNLHIAPKEISWTDLAFTEPVACAVHAVGRMPEADLEDVLVIGAGTIGLSIIRALSIIGAGAITVVEPDPAKRELAEKLGATEVLEPGAMAADRMFTGIIDVVAAQPTLTDACTRIVAGGTVLVMGVPSGPREIPLPSMQRFERVLNSSGMYIPNDFDTAIRWIRDGAFKPAELITDVFALDDAPAAYQRAKQADSIKVLVRISE